MTKEDLSRHLELRKRMASARELLAALKAAAGPRARRPDGMPHAHGASDHTGDLAAEIADMETVIEDLQAEIDRSETAVAVWIATIEDLQTRMIFRLRYVRGAHLEGGGRADRRRQH